MLCRNTGCTRGDNGTRKEFTPVRTWQKFCCNECRNDFHIEGAPLKQAVKRYLEAKLAISDLSQPVTADVVLKYHQALVEMRALSETGIA